jgi:putative phosphoribosyl transferase
MARKIGVPWQPELAMGAIAGSVQLLDGRTIDHLRIAAADIEKVIAHERALIRNYEDLYRLGKPPLDLQGKTAVLVDDGLATGSTMTAAARYARNLNAAKIVIAVPVGSEDGCARLRAESDKLICLATPHDFSAVSEWYRDFRQTSDAEVQNLLAENRRRFGQYSVIPAGS